MSASAPCNSPDSPAQLPADAYYQLIHTLQRTLPPPLSDSPEDRVRRDHAAIARIAALAPANAADADIAAVYVAASEQWKDCLRLVQEPDISAVWAMKCRAQANSMMRQAQSALLLRRMQAARQKTEANADVREREAWTEHCAIGMMTQARSPLRFSRHRGRKRARFSSTMIPRSAPSRQPIRVLADRETRRQ